MKTMLDRAQNHRQAPLCGIIRLNAPQAELWAYGGGVNGNARRTNPDTPVLELFQFLGDAP
jgi:hypothetical protein